MVFHEWHKTRPVDECPECAKVDVAISVMTPMVKEFFGGIAHWSDRGDVMGALIRAAVADLPVDQRANFYNDVYRDMLTTHKLENQQ